MTVNIKNEYPLISEHFMTENQYASVASDIVSKTLQYEKCPFEAEVSILLTDDEGILKINKKERNIDLSTDVLSFPMIPFESPAHFTGLDKDVSLFNPDSKELLLGDIVISIDHCIAQALDYGHSIEREYAFLIVHSVLHLLGYDHVKADEASIMEQKQEAILSILGISR